MFSSENFHNGHVYESVLQFNNKNDRKKMNASSMFNLKCKEFVLEHNLRSNNSMNLCRRKDKNLGKLLVFRLQRDIYGSEQIRHK